MPTVSSGRGARLVLSFLSRLARPRQGCEEEGGGGEMNLWHWLTHITGWNSCEPLIKFNPKQYGVICKGCGRETWFGD